jgi:hypothetical protein
LFTGKLFHRWVSGVSGSMPGYFAGYPYGHRGGTGVFRV